MEKHIISLQMLMSTTSALQIRTRWNNFLLINIFVKFA